jgi:Rad3-related DNA helicase
VAALHQGDILRSYASDHADTPDLALELPTGTGKTLPGLLITDWVRRVRTARVVYACPTRQLARQVARTAGCEGMPAEVLVGSSRDWSLDAQTRYEAAEALAIVTYSTVFNSSPKLAPADLIVFDDAHAGEQYVAQQYAIDIRRWESPEVYDALLTALAPGLDGMLIQRLRDLSPDPGAHHQVRLVMPLRQAGMVERIDRVLSALPTPWSFGIP